MMAEGLRALYEAARRGERKEIETKAVELPSVVCREETVAALRRALVIGRLHHTMSIAQLVGVYPA